MAFYNEITIEKVKNKVNLKFKSEFMATWRNTSNDIVKCPKCGFVFSKQYSRVVSCKTCAMATSGCVLIKCPRCQEEF
ncbi:MAG: hypothetical protein APG12_01315 [Candidatus Methanofastidiosum methylothiophilum]|uniref:Uncharacterized protein n=1 Tax=Candidatus Methanofastidiosum methylothiophilum TaxID=1705564 RepID=A0A150IXS8_9EURY|nr:MAG: hypothetical protein APG10_01153 [Candidatus Methanofastidiosum methylthiophilus]KYC48505.1 MAG: hypothetical protein APG11_00312 [Candidatus Methanofastidiosum methylthiophilus]KYC49668.1 MAG: hypothetical protein APG12_01315 [Candidatus Methanofastidiosum methylthiophilus]